MTKIFAVLFVACLSVACVKSEVKSFYTRAQVQPLTVAELPDGEIVIRYRTYPESEHYSGGVDYIKTGNKMRVIIGRCRIGEECAPMSGTIIPLDKDWQVEVRIPYHGERVSVAYADGEEQVYPK